MRKLLLILLLLFLVHGAWADVGFNLQDPFGDRGGGSTVNFLDVVVYIAAAGVLVLICKSLAWIFMNVRVPKFVGYIIYYLIVVGIPILLISYCASL